MDKIHRLLLAFLTSFSLICCKTKVNSIQEELIGAWKLDSTLISGKRFTTADSQTIIFLNDSTYQVFYEEADVVVMRNGTYSIHSTADLFYIVLIANSDKNKYINYSYGLKTINLKVLSITKDFLCYSIKSKLRTGTNEIKEYTLTNYFSKAIP